MRGERGEVDYSITKPSKGLTRAQMREQLAADMAAFEANKSNAVEVVPRGASGFNPKPTAHLAPVAGKKNSIIENLAKKSRAGYTSRVWNDAGGKK